MRKSIIDRDIQPAFKNRLLVEISADDLRALYKKVKARGSPAAAAHVRDIVKQVYAFAILHGEKVDNPADAWGAGVNRDVRAEGSVTVAFGDPPDVPADGVGGHIPNHPLGAAPDPADAVRKSEHLMLSISLNQSESPSLPAFFEWRAQFAFVRRLY